MEVSSVDRPTARTIIRRQQVPVGDLVPEKLIPQGLRDLQAIVDEALAINNFTNVGTDIIVHKDGSPVVGIQGNIPTVRKEVFHLVVLSCLGQNTGKEDLVFAFAGDRPNGTTKIKYF